MRWCGVLGILGIIPLALIVPRRSIVWRVALHANIVGGVGKIVLPYSALAHHTNGEDQEQTRDGYSTNR